MSKDNSPPSKSPSQVLLQKPSPLQALPSIILRYTAQQQPPLVQHPQNVSHQGLGSAIKVFALVDLIQNIFLCLLHLKRISDYAIILDGLIRTNLDNTIFSKVQEKLYEQTVVALSLLIFMLPVYLVEIFFARTVWIKLEKNSPYQAAAEAGRWAIVAFVLIILESIHAVFVLCVIRLSRLDDVEMLYLLLLCISVRFVYVGLVFAFRKQVAQAPQEWVNQENGRMSLQSGMMPGTEENQPAPIIHYSQVRLTPSTYKTGAGEAPAQTQS